MKKLLAFFSLLILFAPTLSADIFWSGTGGGALNAEPSSWLYKKMPSAETDVVILRYAQSAPLYFEGTDPVCWTNKEWAISDGASYTFDGELALGKGNSWWMKSTSAAYPVRYGSKLRLTSGTMGFLDTMEKEMIVAGDNRGNAYLTIDGPNAKWQMGKLMGTRFGYSSGHVATLTVTNGGTFVGALSVGHTHGSTGNVITVTGKGSLYTIPADHTQEMRIGGLSAFNKMLLSDGGRFENLSATATKIGYGKTYGRGASSNNVLRLESGSTFYNRSTLYLGHLVCGGGYNRLEITGGSKMVLGSAFYMAYNDENEGKPEVGDRLLVSGEGSELTVTNNMVIGNRACNDIQMTIESNAVVRPLARFHLGAESYASTNTTVTIREGGVLDLSDSTETSRTIFLGWHGSSRDLSLVVDKGGLLCITNGTLRHDFSVRGGHNNRIVVQNGGKMILTNTTLSVGCGQYAKNGKLIIKDGGFVRFDDDNATANLIIGADAPDALLSVDNGELIASNMYLRSSHASPGASNSVVQVINGGHIAVSRLLLGNQGSRNSTLAITNGFVEVLKNSFQVGLDGGVDNHICIGGTNSYLSIPNNSFHIKNATTLDIDIPEAGVSGSHALICANQTSFNGKLTVTVNAPTEYFGPRTVTLLKAKSADIDYSMLDVTVKGNPKAKIVQEARELKVDIPRSFGLKVFIF